MHQFLAIAQLEVAHQQRMQILRKTIALQRYLLPPKNLVDLGRWGQLKSQHNQLQADLPSKRLVAITPCLNATSCDRKGVKKYNCAKGG
jgi:hypothetical protein